MTASNDSLGKPPRPAATVVVVRDAPLGIEVLLLRRAERGDHNSGAWVFPGGLVDAADRSAQACCRGVEPAAADARLGVAAHALDYWAAAMRECFEEAGLLYAREADGRPLVLLRRPREAVLGGVGGEVLRGLGRRAGTSVVRTRDLRSGPRAAAATATRSRDAPGTRRP